MFTDPNGHLLTGADADRTAATHPAGFEANPKGRIDDGTVWLGERELAVADLIAAVLARVADEARRVAGQIPATVVLTHPAAWSRTRLAILADAARRADLGEVGFVAETVAAAVYFATVLGRDLPPGQCLVVYDLGAGTFDTSVVRRAAARFEVVAADGLPNLGGLDLDAAVVDHARSLTTTAADAWGRLDWPETSATATSTTTGRWQSPYISAAAQVVRLAFPLYSGGSLALAERAFRTLLSTHVSAASWPTPPTNSAAGPPEPPSHYSVTVISLSLDES